MSDGTSTTMEVRLNARLPSVQRGDRYEDPLAYWLEVEFPGSRVTGGGTLRSREGEPLVCGIDAEVVGDPDAVEDAVVEYLESLGAPRGSTVALTGRAPRDLGTAEGVGLYLARHGLTEEVYAENDVNEVLDALTPMLATSDGTLIVLSTPAGKRGIFYTLWTEGGPEWQRLTVRADDCPRHGEAFLASERRRMGDRIFSEEYGAAFVDEEENRSNPRLLSARAAEYLRAMVAEDGPDAMPE